MDLVNHPQLVSQTDDSPITAVAIVALPNDASIALHEKLGYRIVGTITDAGYKLERFWDTMILEADLS